MLLEIFQFMLAYILVILKNFTNNFSVFCCAASKSKSVCVKIVFVDM